jgi:Tc toxin complex TcA C-terminal TcB-binding domain/Neuraminidase-like domain/Salmonella virulence plasmid 28.1kDa A protein
MANITITGKVSQSNGNPVTGLKIVVNQRQFRQKIQLGETETQDKGSFSIALTNIDDKASYYVEAMKRDGATLLSKGPVAVKAGDQKLHFVLDNGTQQGNAASKYLADDLGEFVEQWKDPTNKNKTISIDDARFVADQTELPVAEAWRWLKANELEAKLHEPSEAPDPQITEILYGLLKQGLPGNLAALSALPTARIEQSLHQALEDNDIDVGGANIPQLMRKWNTLLIRKALTEKNNKLDASLGDIVGLAGIEDQKTRMMELLATHEGTEEEFWAQLGTIINRPGRLARLRKVVQLAGFTGFQPEMLKALLNETIPGNQHAMAALAGRDAEDWKDFIDTASASESAVPDFIEGTNERKRREQYARRLARTTERAFATKAFFGRLGKLNDANAGFGSARMDLQTFFARNPDFDFKTASIEALTEGQGLDLAGIADQPRLLKELCSVRRMQAYADRTEAIYRLRQDGLDCASAVAKMPRKEFARRYAVVFGTKAEAESAHQKAAARASLTLAFAINHFPSQYVETAVTKGVDATIRNLFGSLDACACEHCLSLYSPAAYLTDILHFLESRSPSAYDELVRCRPDIPGLLLNCENTNTPLPYVDLVIELLEDFIAPPTSSTVHQTTLTAAELGANPEHQNAEAYNALAQAVYPRSLPFHYSLEELRIYLTHLGQTRHSLMTSFYPKKEEDAFDESLIAMEYLGISKQEHDIIIGQIAGDGTTNSGVWNFYGFDKETDFKPIPDPVRSGEYIAQGTWLDVMSGRVDVLLQQADLQYVDLLTLLSCQFINPEREKVTIEAVSEHSQDTCQLHQLRLEGLNENHLKRIHRFVRLARRLQWSFYDLDRAFTAFAIEPFDHNNRPKFLKDQDLKTLSQAEQIRRRFDCTIEESLALWGDIGARQYTDFTQETPVPQPSLYQKLFRNKAVLHPLDEAFPEDPSQLSGDLATQANAIQMVLQISEAEYHLLLEKVVLHPPERPNKRLKLNNLTVLYRYVQLSRWIGVSLNDLFSLFALSGINVHVEEDAQKPFTPIGMYQFLWRVDFIQASGFSILELDYLLRDSFTEPSDIAPSASVIETFLAECKALPVVNAETITEKFATAFGLTAKAAELLLKKFPNRDGGSTVPMVDDFLSTHEETVKDDIYRKFGKAAFFIKNLKIADDELAQIFKYDESERIFERKEWIGCLNFDSLPVEPVAMADYAGFEALVNLIRARDLLGVGTTNLFEVLNNAFGETPDKQQWGETVSQKMKWDTETLENLIGKPEDLENSGKLGTTFPDDFRNGDLILRLKNSLGILQKVGGNVKVIRRISNSEINPNTFLNDVKAIKKAAKAKHNDAHWSRIAKPLRDALRERQRAALVDYAVHRSEEWTTVEELYAHFLIDVEMKPVAMTSRLKQASCSVQLFIDRLLLNLERNPEGQPIRLAAEQAAEWKTWRKLYRVWEANRKIFLYPENWIEPELRDDQTPFFEEAVSQLLQNQLTPETAEDAFRSYLEKLDEVARLEIVGILHQKEYGDVEQEAVDIVHIFGRTYAQPHKYFHRTLEHREWTPWQKIETEIDSDHLVPVIFNRRLCLFWLFFTQEPVEGGEIDPSKKVPKAEFFWKIQVAWSEFQQNKWSGKKLSKQFIHSEYTNSQQTLKKLRRGLLIRPYLDLESGNLMVNVTPATGKPPHPHFRHPDRGQNGYCSASFRFENTVNNPLLILCDLLPVNYSLPLPTKTGFANGQIQADNAQSLELTYEAVTPQGEIEPRPSLPLLNHVLDSRFHLAIESGAVEPFSGRFVYQDRKNSFYVSPVSVLDDVLPDLPDLSELEIGLEQTWQEHLQPAVGSLMRIHSEFPPTPGSNNDFSIDGDDLIVNEPDQEGNHSDSNEVEMVCPENRRGEGYASTLRIRTSDAYTLRFIRRPGRGYRFVTFYHPQVKGLVQALHQSGVSGVLRRSRQMAEDSLVFQQYQPTEAIVSPEPKGIVDFAYGSPYSQYNWELFFHLPIHIACRLSADQRFEEARKWFHYVFDPTTGESGGKERFWQFKPFYDEAQERTGESLAEFLRNKEGELTAQLEKWAANPFQPHVIARMRVTAYMKFTVTKYIENLITWGDQLFRRDTIESINEATNLYVLAANILGKPPRKIPARTRRADQSFQGLQEDLDAFSNALVTIETYLPPSESGQGDTTSALGRMFYFCIPSNDLILKQWGTVADRLFKIRHSLNIEGLARTLPLFEPPIDPALLVRAAAAGLDLDTLLNEESGERPLYRFSFMLQKANELVSEVKGLGAALLSALEKRDAEALSLLRSSHEQRLLEAVLQVRERQLEEAKELLAGTEKSLESAKARLKYYTSRKNINRYEKESLTNAGKAQTFTTLQGESNVYASVLAGISELKIGSPTTSGTEFGGLHLSAIYSGLSAAAGTKAGFFSYMASRNATLGSYERRMDDWQFQADQAKVDIAQLEKQVLAAEIRLAIAERERSNHKLQMEQSAETDEFMRGKFTNQQLFNWMAGQLSSLYFQTYQMAYDLAKRVEKCFQFELPQDTSTNSYIKSGYWDNLKKGLLAGEKLQFDLRRLEMAYLEQSQREYELTKHISVLQIDPLALIQLRATGQCDVELPESLFEMDCPGHRLRRIKTVAVSIPCITGPYASVNCTLTLVKSSIRHLTGVEIEDPPAGNKSIVTSSAQNDSGLFETNLRDERYLPFEYFGAISTWRLELPADVKQFDYDTISDVILHLRYTASKGGQALRTAAVGELNKPIEEARAAGNVRLFSVRHEFPTEWTKFKSITIGSATKAVELTLKFRAEHYPFWSQGKVKEAKQIALFAKVKKDMQSNIEVAAEINNEGELVAAKDTLITDTALPGLRAGKLDKVPLPKPIHLAPEKKFTLYFNDNSMDDLLILLMWA